jgi:TRAP transporter TAXI family solute receptor
MARRLLTMCGVLLLVGCERGPDEQALRAQVQEKLASQTTPGLLEIASLHRRGSSPLPATGGGQRVVVYFNATLRFTQDYEFGSWDKLSPASLAYVLGAKEKGLMGAKTQNRSGDQIYVFGTATYEWTGNAWNAVPSVTEDTAPAPAADGTAPPSRSKQVIDKLAAMVNLAPFGVDATTDQVIAEELDRADENISRRLARREHTFTIASGPPRGQYTRFVTALVEALTKAGARAEIRNRESEGSVENARLLASGEADYAIIQSNLAIRALSGEEPFARGGAIRNLRAVGALFPEPVHIVVSDKASVRTVADLRGKRVDIGTPESGTRYDAELILAAHGLRAEDLAEARQDGPEAAVRRMQQGQLDAIFATTFAPIRGLQVHAASYGLRLLSMTPADVEGLVARNPGLVPIVLPASTYPGQTEDVHTVGAVALLVTTGDVPDAEVERVTGVVFSGIDFESLGSPAGGKISLKTALRGISIPMHAGASRRIWATQEPATQPAP